VINERDRATLFDLLHAAQLASEFVAEMNLASFRSDRKTQAAVLHQLTVLGEAVKRLSPEFRNAHPVLPWRLIAGMRDHLIHRYDSVDLEEVWQTVQRDLPALHVAIMPLLDA
jgi:uncharacterized protein with HEPN domain